MGEGRDIADPEGLLTWLCTDRFTGTRADDRLLAYLEHHGLAAAPRPSDADPASHSDCVGLCLTFEDSCLFTWRHGWGEATQRLEIEHWRRLLLQMVEDRCEGRDAWERVLRLLERAGVETTSAWRGYG